MKKNIILILSLIFIGYTNCFASDIIGEIQYFWPNGYDEATMDARREKAKALSNWTEEELNEKGKIILDDTEKLELERLENTKQVLKKYSPLEKNEYLEVEINGRQLKIYKANNNKKELYLTVDNVASDSCFISENHRRLLFFCRASTCNEPLFFLDGDNGELSYYGFYSCGSRMDRAGKYVIYQNIVKNVDDKILYILDLETGKQIKKYELKLKDTKTWFYEDNYVDVSYYRAGDNLDFDFLIYVNYEDTIVAKGYINVEQDEIVFEYDDSDKDTGELRDITRIPYNEDFWGIVNE